MHLLVPIKPLRLAKSRLRGAADGGAGDARSHSDLVTAVARDTMIAARDTAGVAAVLVVTSDPALTATFHDDGFEVLPDSPSNGLNAALCHGEEFLRGRSPHARIGALQADLPSLRPAELARALDVSGERRAFCPDRHGTGTTLLLSTPGGALHPCFGPGSATAHAASGAARLDGTWESLRCDVDTDADLRAAGRLGLGPHTSARLARRVDAVETP